MLWKSCHARDHPVLESHEPCQMTRASLSDWPKCGKWHPLWPLRNSKQLVSHRFQALQLART